MVGQYKDGRYTIPLKSWGTSLELLTDVGVQIIRAELIALRGLSIIMLYALALRGL